MFTLPVGDKALESSDGDRFIFDAEDADFFALLLLGADASADGGQGVGFLDFHGGFGEAAFADELDEGGDVVVDGASLDATGLFAPEASARFEDGHFWGVAVGDFVEVVDPILGFLFGHRLSGNFFSHGSTSLRRVVCGYLWFQAKQPHPPWEWA